jgi:hypothetical protein
MHTHIVENLQSLLSWSVLWQRSGLSSVFYLSTVTDPLS